MKRTETLTEEKRIEYVFVNSFNTPNIPFTIKVSCHSDNKDSDVKIIAEKVSKAVNNYESVLSALKKIMNSAEKNNHIDFFTFDKWCDDIKAAIRNAEQ